ncbi:MAG: helix-turn-helix domain-containing protein [Propionibacteriaceae bacterium]|jgi:excisionase family DNA binding protein|nr:helix-turn-helix domain-containing protein [Propionibacteriaceae bacterium]
MNTRVMTLAPGAVNPAAGETSVWERALIEFVKEASAEGKTVIVTTEVETLTPEEVARGLNLSRSTVSRRIAAGAIKSVKIGNRHHVPYPEFRRLWEDYMSKVVDASIDDIEAELFGDG